MEPNITSSHPTTDHVSIAPNRYMAMDAGERYSELLRKDAEIERLDFALALCRSVLRQQCEDITPMREENMLLREALEMLYDRWENGDPCWDSNEPGTTLGNAVELSYEEEKEILSLIKPFKTPQGEPAPELPGTREPVVTAPQGNAGESPAHDPQRCPAVWLLTTDVGIRCTLVPGHVGKHRAPEPFWHEHQRIWRGVVAHDPVECAVCDVELRGIERRVLPEGAVERAVKRVMESHPLKDEDRNDRT